MAALKTISVPVLCPLFHKPLQELIFSDPVRPKMNRPPHPGRPKMNVLSPNNFLNARSLKRRSACLFAQALPSTSFECTGTNKVAWWRRRQRRGEQREQGGGGGQQGQAGGRCGGAGAGITHARARAAGASGTGGGAGARGGARGGEPARGLQHRANGRGKGGGEAPVRRPAGCWVRKSSALSAVAIAAGLAPALWPWARRRCESFQRAGSPQRLPFFWDELNQIKLFSGLPSIMFPVRVLNY
jgi:hypothetical protein